MFKTRSVYIKIRQNLIEVTDLDSNETVSKPAIQPFSSTRNIVSNFNKANETIGSALKELGIKSGFFRPRLEVLMQQLEGLEGGLSDIEKRALRDLAEIAGANKVILLEESQPVSADLALTYIRNNK